MTMQLEKFGRKLRQIRERAGLTQAELALRLAVSPGLVSNWERAYEHEGRRWKPDRASAVRLVGIFADQLRPEEVESWVALAGYKLGRTEIQRLFSSNLKRLALPPEQRLFGIGEQKEQLRRRLEQAAVPWLVAIDGIGGIGKTVLAGALVREIIPTNRYYDVAWISAKQEEFRPSVGIQPTDRPALNVDAFVDASLEQLGDRKLLLGSPEEKMARLTNLLKTQPYLIVIDNLETVDDYQTLVPVLRNLANPSKFLLTSRYSLRLQSDVFSLNLQELSQAATFDFLNFEAEVRGLPTLTNASRDQLERIYQAVGGNPLALKLIVGQITVLPLAQILESLKKAQGQKIDELYLYIYRQAWHHLDLAGRQVLLAMPLAQGGTLSQLLALSDELETDEFNQAVERLVSLSLIEVSGDLEQPRYHIHRLTETFLLTEVIKRWQ